MLRFSPEPDTEFVKAAMPNTRNVTVIQQSLQSKAEIKPSDMSLALCEAICAADLEIVQIITKAEPAVYTTNNIGHIINTALQHPNLAIIQYLPQQAPILNYLRTLSKGDLTYMIMQTMADTGNKLEFCTLVHTVWPQGLKTLPLDIKSSKRNMCLLANEEKLAKDFRFLGAMLNKGLLSKPKHSNSKPRRLPGLPLPIVEIIFDLAYAEQDFADKGLAKKRILNTVSC